MRSKPEEDILNKNLELYNVHAGIICVGISQPSLWVVPSLLGIDEMLFQQRFSLNSQFEEFN